MPRNQFQRMVFAFITVVITVHAYVFYSLYVIHGKMFMQITSETGVLAAINKMGGVPVFGTPIPIWAVVLIEFVLAYLLEVILGSPLSFKLACKNFNPRETHPVLFETTVICATVGIMCPSMSFIATFLYYNYQAGFNMWTLLAEWLKLMCYNFPFAFFTQLFFIQPIVRTIFKIVFTKDIKARKSEPHTSEKQQVTVIKGNCKMFKIDDIVTYGINGVCKIVEIEEKDFLGTKNAYFVLKPLNGDKSTYFVPVDNENLLNKMRKLLSEDEINRLIDSIPNEKAIWIDNERERRECYKRIIADGNHSDLIRMIKAIYFEKKEREEKGKKLHISDERFLKKAEKILYDEFQYVLNLSEKEVISYIFRRIDKKTSNEHI